MEKIEAAILLEKIISKGGLMGKAAKLYEGDKKKSEKFVIECSEQCHNKIALDLWGEELVYEIQKYVKSHG